MLCPDLQPSRSNQTSICIYTCIYIYIYTVYIYIVFLIDENPAEDIFNTDW